MTVDRYIACDLGAESGRVLLGSLEDERLILEEVHRFPNGPIDVNGSLRWDVLRIFEELKTGMRKVAARGVPIAGISCDSWGVDYVLLRGNEPMLTAPYHYRDGRTDGAFERAFAIVPADRIFAETGIQFMPINTLYQLHADSQQRPGILEAAEFFLNIGDYYNYLLSGVVRAEESLASTTQLYNPFQRSWSADLVAKFNFPQRIFPLIVPSATLLGPLLPPIAEETGLRDTQVVAGCSHDTAAAVAAVPASGEGWAYLSSGTWSLLGVETARPIVNDLSRSFNFTNEVGFGGRIRFLKNIIGLWIVQECRRAWARSGREYSYEELTSLATKAAPLVSLLDPRNEKFGRPGDMPAKIVEYCRATGQPVPGTVGAMVRCALESLALCYRKTLAELECAAGCRISRLHVVGGGSRNELLNRFTADAAGIPVFAGPAECTGIGNVLVQSIALGRLHSLEAARSIVRDSFQPEIYEPQDTGCWEQAYDRFCRLSELV